jgi:hypothetical protein
MPPEKPSSRSLFGMIAMIFGLILYAFLAAGMGELLDGWPILVQSVYYLIAGLLWIIPAKKILYWMGNQKP